MVYLTEETLVDNIDKHYNKFLFKWDKVPYYHLVSNIDYGVYINPLYVEIESYKTVCIDNIGYQEFYWKFNSGYLNVFVISMDK